MMKNVEVFLTHQPEHLDPHPDIREVSSELMFTVADLYHRPEKASHYRERYFKNWHSLGVDSGGFQFLMGKLKNPNPKRTITIYKMMGLNSHDFPIQLDLPPSYHLTHKEKARLIFRSAEFFHVMNQEIPVIPVVHGWTIEELKTSLELIENPEKLAVGSFHGATKHWVMENIIPHGKYAVGGYLSPSTVTVDHIQREKFAVGAYLQSGQFTCDHIANTPRRKRLIAAGGYLQSGRYILDEAGNLKKPRIIGTGTYIPTVAVGTYHPNAYRVATPHAKAEQVRQRAPVEAVIERLGLVLNLLRDRELFVLGGASPHDQHMIFMGGARYCDTSAWRLKAYLGEIYLPELGSRAVGEKAKVPRLSDSEKILLRECLKDPTHPLNGISLEEFLEVAKIRKIDDWRKLMQEKQLRFGAPPFETRALHNAWVIKRCEEAIANEYANDPDRYYRYLLERFNGHPNLTRKVKKLWRTLKRPYVQDRLTSYLKGQPIKEIEAS